MYDPAVYHKRDILALHHEKLDENGYPFHLPESELSLGSRIMTVSDIFSAITEERQYRKSMEKEKSFLFFRMRRGADRFQKTSSTC